MPITPESFSVTRIQMFYNDIPLSWGTGFFWKFEEKTFLVTNWHNVSGRDRLTGKPLDEKNLALPNRMDAVIFVRSPEDEDLFQRRVLRLNWIIGEATEWLVHGDLGETADIAMRLLSPDIANLVLPINDQRGGTPEVRVATDVFLLGFPLGIEVENLPIWKRGTVASELDFNVDQLPKFLVDTASSKGMSGSPVIFKSSTWKQGPEVFSSTREKVFLVGVYSGRIVKDGDLSAQLGEVWKASLLGDIAKEGTVFTSE